MLKVLCREARLIKVIMIKSQYELQVLINGKPVREYAKDGRTYVEAKSGSTYSIKFKNNTWKRVLAVFSVDGIDVLKGKSASEADSGYVVSGYGTLEIKGFRVNNETEAAFKFFEKGNGNGYAEVKGNASSAGVIGVRIYSEKEKPVVINTVFVDRPVYIDRPVPVYPRPYWSSRLSYDYSCDTYGDTSATYSSNVSNSSLGGVLRSKSSDSNEGVIGGTSTRSVPVAKSLMSLNDQSEKPRGFDMTTGWGDSVESKVTTVSFERGMLTEQIEILYASRESLIQMEVKLDNTPQVAIPSAFKSLEFCAPPPNWRG